MKFEIPYSATAIIDVDFQKVYDLISKKYETTDKFFIGSDFGDNIYHYLKELKIPGYEKIFSADDNDFYTPVVQKDALDEIADAFYDWLYEN